MPSMKNLSQWLTGSIDRNEGLFCALFIDLNKPHVKTLCVSPGKLFHARILTYLRNVSNSDVATPNLQEAFSKNGKIEMTIFVLGVFSLANDTPKELRKKFHSRIYGELRTLGHTYEPWLEEFQETGLDLSASFKIVVNNGEVESMEPSAKAADLCESMHDVKHLLVESSKSNLGYFQS